MTKCVIEVIDLEETKLTDEDFTSIERYLKRSERYDLKITDINKLRGDLSTEELMELYRDGDYMCEIEDVRRKDNPK